MPDKNGWLRVDEMFPDTKLGETIWICYERDEQVIVEEGYVCGDNLIKGSSERYPYPTYWQRFHKPEPPENFKY